MSTRKRGAEDDSSGNAKKPKNGPSFLPPQGDLKDLANNNPPLNPNSKVAEDIARKRAEIAAKFAAMKNTSKPPTPALTAQSMQGGRPASGLDPDLMKKVAEARKKVMEMAAKAKNPYLSSQEQAGPSTSSAAATGVHPLLMSEQATTSSNNRYKPMVPKFATVKANARAGASPAASSRGAPSSSNNNNTFTTTQEAEDNRNNPYFDKRLAGPIGDPTGGVKERASRSLKFNTKGKFIRLGEQARSEARLEDLKKRIAESSRKAGLEDEMETVEKQVRRQPPPEVEWWDEDYLPTKSYNDVLTGSASQKIRSSDSPITIYIQHPIQLPAPGDKIKVELKPLKLTKKEQKKMRRQRRAAELQDKQDRQKMGLLPPDPPKVKLSNMMKVLTSDAVADPTKIEARVRREMLQRRKAHEKDNETRKLTDEQRREKLDKRKDDDESKGVFCAVFKVRYLSNPSHRFKVRKNAEQHGLTGVIIFNPKFVLIVVEGGAKSIKAYKHLMLNRIVWTEEARPRAGTEAPDGSPTTIAEEPSTTPAVEGEGGPEEPQSLADNYGQIIWTGESRDRAFSSFRSKNCPTDGLAKEFLGPRMEGYWDVAKKWQEGHEQ